MRVIAYPKHPHPYQVSREVIEDTPEAWRALEAWWTKMVRSLAGHVDAWGVINEPMWRRWTGDHELILRYWALLRRTGDPSDPDPPLIGPPLPPNTAGGRSVRKKHADHVDCSGPRIDQHSPSHHQHQMT